MKKSLLSIAVMAMSACGAFVSHAQLPDEKPLLTIGCISDLHNQQTLISGSVDNVRLRGTVLTTLQAMKEQENIDMLILGGDYTSDVTIPEENWARVKDLMHDATKGTFPVDAEKFPVLYVTGNHDYEVANFDAIPKPYNAARYYDFIMKYDLGELPESECFFEDADNGNLGTMRVLAAYHYNINGFDFVVLNCAKHYFQSAWNYIYSVESVQWVSDKLDELYAADPDRTVFFVAHVPFPDSNSISNSNKGQSQSAQLKKVLAHHPNVMFLYGHDHGSDNAYIRTKTSQRVTRYNSQANIISAFDEDHIDGLEKGEVVGPVEPAKITTGQFYVTSKATGKYLGFDGNNAGTIETKNLSTVSAYNDENTSFKFEIGLNASGQKYLHIGSGGRFSLGDASPIFVYKVKSSNVDGTITAEQTMEFGTEGDYILAANYNGAYYSLSNALYSSGSTSQRMESAQSTVNEKTLTVEGGTELVWNFGADQTVVEPQTAAFPEGKWYQLKNQQGGGIRENSYLGYYPDVEWTIIPTSATGASTEKTTATSPLICPAAPFEATSTDAIKDRQQWKFVPNAEHTKYCIVNKAFPNGAISNKSVGNDGTTANTSANNTSRWIYVADRTATPDEVEWFTIANEFGTEEGNAISALTFENPLAEAFCYMGFAGGGQQFQYQRYNTTGEAGCRWEFIAVADVAEEPVVEPSADFTAGKFRIINQANGKNLGVDYQASVIEDVNYCDVSVRNADNGTFLIEIGDHPTNGAGQRSITCSTGNRFSIGDATDSYIYKVTSKTDTQYTLEQAFGFNTTDEYVIAQYCRKDPFHFIALSGELYSPGSGNQRLVGVDISATHAANLTVDANNNILWKFEAEATEPVVEPVEPTDEDVNGGEFYIINKADGKYLSNDASNVATIDTKYLSNITSTATAGDFNFYIGTNPTTASQHWLSCGTNGRFSIGNIAVINIFKVTANNGTTITAEKVEKFNTTDEYLLVGVKNAVYYACSNELYNAGQGNDQRLVGTQVTLDGATLTVDANDNIIWNFTTEADDNGDNGNGDKEDPIDLTGDLTAGEFCITNVANKGYLNMGIYNIETDIDPVASNIRSTNGTFYITIGQSDRYIYCGTNNRFSGNTTATASYLYEVDSAADGTIAAHKANAFRIGKRYLIVGLRNSAPYALSSVAYDEGKSTQRLEGVAVTVNGDIATVEGGEELMWEFSVLPEADPSFFSIFMGSMRYYNSIASAGSTVNDSRIAQGMMIYVYSDRIVFQMKNYAETGVINGITIAEKPQPYTVFRTIKKSETGPTDGINEVASDKANEAVYDVLGRRVNKADKGLYIVNGEKVIK